MKNKKNGFTLIEILVVISITVVIMASISGVMSGVFRSQNKNTAIDKISQNGEWILSELKKNVLNANSNDVDGGKYFSCDDDSITITSVKDGEKTTIACLGNDTVGYNIASISGKSVGTTVYLFEKNGDLKLDGCESFVTCSTLPSLQLSEVKFNFTLSAGLESLASGTTRTFLSDIFLRN